MFDVDSFTSAVYDQPTSTESINVPEGEYNGMIKKFVPREIQKKDGTKAVVMDLFWEVDDPVGEVKAITGRDHNQVRQSLFLDTNEGGRLDMSPGRNVQLGRLREALGQNTGNWSFQRVVDVPARILVVHKVEDDGRTFANVTRVGKLGESLS